MFVFYSCILWTGTHDVISWNETNIHFFAVCTSLESVRIKNKHIITLDYTRTFFAFANFNLFYINSRILLLLNDWILLSIYKFYI